MKDRFYGPLWVGIVGCVVGAILVNSGREIQFPRGVAHLTGWGWFGLVLAGASFLMAVYGIAGLAAVAAFQERDDASRERAERIGDPDSATDSKRRPRNL